MILTNLPNIPSLENITRADCSLAQLFANNFTHILLLVVANSTPRDLQGIIFTMVSICDAAPFRDTELSSVLSNVFFDKRKLLFRVTRAPKIPLEILHHLARVLRGVEFFTALFPKFFALRHKDFENIQLNDVENHRLQRGLWLFEVCCALVAAWKSIGDVDLDAVQSGADTRVRRLTRCLRQFLPWELEEIACVYEYLMSTVLHTELSLPRSRSPNNSCISIRGQQYPSMSSRDRSLPALSAKIQVRDCLHIERASSVGLYALNGSTTPSALEKITRRDLQKFTRVRILSQGLLFPRAFQQTPSEAKRSTISKLEGFCLGDEFFYPAFYSLMNWQDRFPRTRAQ